jgi:triacylglycerol esterase/lipase EstA (alpha/beta hydrolase family)
VLVLVIAALAVGVSIAVFSGGSKSRAAAVQAVPGPVLLVPGYGGSVASLQSLATALRDAGKQVLIVSLPDNAEGDLQAQASTLAAAVKAALTSSGAASVDVVGYSAGGVVARLWAREDGGAALARRIVTLGSPQHGTELATLGSLVPGACPLACQQLATGSPLLAQLNAGDETPAGPAWVSVWTTSDDVVLPPDSARLTGALDLTVQSFCRTDTVSHTGLPADKVVQRIVIAVLGTALDTPPVGC